MIEQAAVLSDVSGSALVLVHYADRSADLATLRIKLADNAVKTSKKYNVTCDIKVLERCISILSSGPVLSHRIN